MDFGAKSYIEGVDFDLPAEIAGREAKTYEFSPQKVFLGCPIWNHKGWKGKLYPHEAQPKDFLRHYAEKISAIELNSSFYHLPREDVQKNWLEVTPEDFRFCPKVPQDISHRQNLLGNKELIKMSCESFAAFGEKLGCGFLQLPPHFSYRDLSQLRSFLQLWSREVPLSVEFRHASFFEFGHLRSSVHELLEEHDVGIVICDTPGERQVLHMSLLSGRLFVRFLGYQLHVMDHKRLREWCHRIRAWGEMQCLREIYFFLHQPDDILAPETVKAMAEYLNEICDLGLPEISLVPEGSQASLF